MIRAHKRAHLVGEAATEAPVEAKGEPARTHGVNLLGGIGWI